MDILVIGAGVLGSLYAARLRQAGHMVDLLARPARAGQLREHGIVLEAANSGRVETVHVGVKEMLHEEESYDLVIVAMRMNRVPEVLPMLAANHATPSVLFLGNNPAGAAGWVAALGRERVILGFAAAGGVRRGHVVRYFARPGREHAHTYLGELDGQMTRRIAAIMIALSEAHLGPHMEPNMDAWLKTHAAVVSPIAMAIYAAGGDNYRLARTRDGLVLGMRAVKEGLRALQALNIPLTPASMKTLVWLPEPVLLMYLRGLFNTQAAEISMAGHANAARDEMALLAEETGQLVKAAGIATPALDQLSAWLDPKMPPLAEGSAELKVDMRAVYVGAGVLAGLAVIGLVRLLSRPRR